MHRDGTRTHTGVNEDQSLPSFVLLLQHGKGAPHPEPIPLEARSGSLLDGGWVLAGQGPTDTTASAIGS